MSCVSYLYFDQVLISLVMIDSLGYLHSDSGRDMRAEHIHKPLFLVIQQQCFGYVIFRCTKKKEKEREKKTQKKIDIK